MHEGHRKRMIERVRTHPEGLQDHELLEILLFYAIPRQNTNPLAHRLIASFRTLEGVLSATREQLLTVEGVGEYTATLIASIGETVRRLPQRDDRPPAFLSPRAFSEYLAVHFERHTDEYLELYCLNELRQIKFVKRYSDFREDGVDIPPEELSHVLAVHKPYAIVVAHNHPNGPALPSAEDDDFTAKLVVLCSVTNVRLLDHIIVGRDGMYSYFETGRMEDFRHAYHVNRIVGGKKL